MQSVERPARASIRTTSSRGRSFGIFEDSDLNAAVNGAISGILRPGMRHTNVQRAPRVAAKVRAGTVWTNAYRIVANGVCAAERA